MEIGQFGSFRAAAPLPARSVQVGQIDVLPSVTREEYTALLARIVICEERIDVLEDRTAIHNDVLAVLEETALKHETRLDHIEPTVEGLDQTIRDLARTGGVEMWDE